MYYEKWRHLLKKIQDTRNIIHRTMDTSVPFKADTLGPHIVLPITISCPIVFSLISLTV